MPGIIWMELISRYHNNLLARYIYIEKTLELVIRHYYWPTFWANIEVYVKECDVCITLKSVKYKLYKGLQSLPMPTHCCKDLFMDFNTGLPVSTN